ncbi:carbon-nitrogen hydrolase family protein [Marinicaulis aureus]|uniref:Carbon-nitrogen hydrolase family protein n=1 Tax=Hyphococcus aureus TaxID=2666033 RepID=A0ABW1L3H1_9PROT
MADRTPFLAACVQMRSGLDRAANAADACDLIAEAAGKGARFIATPEMTNVVDRKASRLFENLPEEDGLSEIATFSEAAKAHGAWLLIGSMAVKLEERRAANRAFLFAPDGSITARYDKLHMFDVDLPNGESWKESNVYRPGEEAVMAETPLAKLGLTICYDVRFPHLYRQLAQAGAEVLCVPAAFTRQTGEAHWKTLLTARAIETGSFVIAPAQGGTHEDGRETYGHSLIIGPWGDVLTEAPGDEPGVILAEIDPSAVWQARQRIPNLALEQSFKLAILET